MASLRVTSSLGYQRPVLLEADSGSWYRVFVFSDSLRGVDFGEELDKSYGGAIELSTEATRFMRLVSCLSAVRFEIFMRVISRSNLSTYLCFLRSRMLFSSCGLRMLVAG